jgi:hypothetical protein
MGLALHSFTRLLKRLGGQLDLNYLTKRVADEGGDISLLAGKKDVRRN